MAYCCDFTIAADNAVFAQAGPRVSSPADGFFVPYLTKVVDAKKAREIWMLCRRYPAEKAEQMGLVNTVVPLDQLEAEYLTMVRGDAGTQSGLPGDSQSLVRPGNGRLSRDGNSFEPILSQTGSTHRKEKKAATRSSRNANPRFWDIRQEYAEAHQSILDAYEASQKK